MFALSRRQLLHHRRQALFACLLPVPGRAHNWARNPMCGMRVDIWSIKARTTYHGREYVFYSRHCPERCKAT